MLEILAQSLMIATRMDGPRKRDALPPPDQGNPPRRRFLRRRWSAFDEHDL